MSDPSTHELPLTAEDSSSGSAVGCCRFTQVLTSGRAVVCLLLAMLLATAAAGYFAGRAAQATQMLLPPIEATAAVSSEKFSMATGMISDRAEGLFVLDHNSGLLQCSVIYPRMTPPRFLGLFTVNVGDALASGGKGGQYMMLTGLADFPSSSNRPAASSVIYVLDTSNGNYACYGIPFNAATMNAGRPQQGALVLLSTGTANPVIDRDRLN